MSREGAPVVTLVGKPDCHLCDVARQVVASVCSERAVTWHEVHLADDPALAAEYTDLIPVVLIDGEHHAHWRIWPEDLAAALAEWQGPGL
jgi:hypothetical protein